MQVIFLPKPELFSILTAMMLILKNKFVLILAFLTLESTAQAQFASLDKSTLVELQEDRTPGKTRIMQGFSNSAGIISLCVPAGVFLAGEINGRKDVRQKALYIGESIVVSSLFTWALKYSINRPRPFQKYPDLIKPASNGGSPSFPSGHTSQTFSTATALTLAFPKWYVAVPAFGWAGVVSYSRMYLGVHYPTDVAAGAIVGAGSAWLTFKGNKWLQQRKAAKKQVVALY